MTIKRGETVYINSPNGWGGRFHHCKGIVAKEIGQDFEYPDSYIVIIKDDPFGQFSEVTHTVPCSEKNLIRSVNP